MPLPSRSGGNIWRPERPQPRRRQPLLPARAPTGGALQVGVATETDTALPVIAVGGEVAIGFGLRAAAVEPLDPTAPVHEQFRFWVENIPTGHVRTQNLQLEAWAYDDTLNRPGSLTGGIPLTSTYATEEMLEPWRTAVYVERDGKLEWGGILTPPQLSVGAQALDLAAFGWLGYFDRRTIRKNYTDAEYAARFVGVDQFEMFRTLVMDAQDESYYGAGYDLGITVTWDQLSGVVRDRSEDYRSYKAKNLGEALRELGALIDGFDFAMHYTINTTTNRIDKTIKLYYPRKGRDTGFVFDYDPPTPDEPHPPASNVIAVGFADPVAFAWTGDGWGTGSETERLYSSYVDETLRDIYPPFDAAPSWSSVSDPATLAEHTASYFGRASRPRRIPVWQVDPDMTPRWGDYENGDTVTFRQRAGYGSTGLAGQKVRVTGTKVSAGGIYELTAADEGPVSDA